MDATRDALTEQSGHNAPQGADYIGDYHVCLECQPIYRDIKQFAVFASQNPDSLGPLVKSYSTMDRAFGAVGDMDKAWNANETVKWRFKVARVVKG